MSPEIMSSETLFIKDRATYFLNQTVLNPVNAQQLAPEETFTKSIQLIKDLNFTSGEVNSLLQNMLNGFARKSRGWNLYAIRASLVILPFIGLKKITSGQIEEDYRKAIANLPSYTEPSHTETTGDGGFEALIEAGMILLPHISAFSRKKINTEVVPILRQELKKRHPYTNKEVYERLADRIDYLDNSLKTGLTNPIEIKPKDTTEIARKFKEFSNNLRYQRFSPEQFATLDLLVKEAITHFGMNPIQIIQMSNMSAYRINWSIIRLKVNGSIPDRNVHEDFLSLQVQELLGKAPLTQLQIAHALGPGITKKMVRHTERKLIERGQHKKNNNQPQEQTSSEQDIIVLRRQGFSSFQIANQLDMPITRVHTLIKKLMREGKIERQIRRRPLNHPIIERGIKIDARVDELQSNNPGITQAEIAKRLNLPKYLVKNSLQRVKVYRQIEQLIAQGKTALQIAQERRVDQEKAKFDIARLKKLRDLQHSLQN